MREREESCLWFIVFTQARAVTLLDTVLTFQPDTGGRPGSDYAEGTPGSAPLTQIPVDATDVNFTVAYRGPLGQEEIDAVVGGIGVFNFLPC
jgi:hypothetical protein